MAAAWGGFVFVLNLIAIHSLVLVLLGRYSSKLHRAYSLFYVIGITGAVQVPVIGWGPLRSLEQLGALAAFIGLQVWARASSSVMVSPAVVVVCTLILQNSTKCLQSVAICIYSTSCL